MTCSKREIEREKLLLQTTKPKCNVSRASARGPIDQSMPVELNIRRRTIGPNSSRKHVGAKIESAEKGSNLGSDTNIFSDTMRPLSARIARVMNL